MKQFGTVVWFDSKKGYGFISPSLGGKDIFVHFSDLQQLGFKELKTGEIVKYEIGNNFHGQPKAVAVEVLNGK